MLVLGEKSIRVVKFFIKIRNWIQTFINCTVRETDPRLLLPDEGVDLRHVDVVQLFDGRFDLMLVGFDVTNEDESVVVLDLFHGGLGRQRMLNDVVSIHPVGRRNVVNSKDIVKIKYPLADCKLSECEQPLDLVIFMPTV